jgi:poly(3-hydroxybutyrate) depolymerase
MSSRWSVALVLSLAACGAGGDGPVPSDCIDDVTPGAHTFVCGGLRTDAYVPAACQQPGCGLIMELHGDTGDGLLMDANTNLMALGAARGYIVIAPTGPLIGGSYPGSTWTLADDDILVAMLQTFARVFRTDPKKTHLTGFSRGGYLTWRLLCEHADLFASVAPAASGAVSGTGCAGLQQLTGVPEVSCPFDAAVPNGMPAREIPVLFLIGRTDAQVPYACSTGIRDRAIAAWSLAGPVQLDGDAQYAHDRWSGAGVLETFEHSYQTVADGPEATVKGHCFPGSTMDPYAPQYAVPCAPPNAFNWGAEVLDFFVQHPDF